MTDFETDIYSRLIALGDKLKHAEAHLKLRRPMSSDDKITNAELGERYALLLDQVNQDASEAEKHCHHVSDLEYSIKLWLASIDNGSV